MSTSPDRRLAAILSADVAGYSRLMADDEDATVRTLRAWREQVAALVEDHRGRLADFTGDNFLAEFPAAHDAIACALEIQRVIAVRNEAVPEARRMRFRIGAHLGDVRHEDGRLYGDGVNVAARLQALAEPGGLCLSLPLVETVRGKIALELEDLGEQPLKNLPSPLHVYRASAGELSRAWGGSTAAQQRPTTRGRLALVALLALIALGSGVWWSQRRDAALDSPAQAPTSNAAAALSPIRSLAVLPLDNLSGDPEQEFFADGMTETLIAELAKLPGVRVISRTSVMQFKGKDTPMGEIAKSLGVDGVIEGSVMRAGDQVRITAQLIDARSDHHVWAEQYDRELARVLEIQREVARAVAAEIQVALTPQQVARFRSPKPVKPEAQDAYFRAVMHSEKLSHEGFQSAIEQVERAIALEPEWAPPRALLARAIAALVYPWRSFPAAAELPRARREALRAVALDPDLAEAHAALAMTHLLEWEWRASEQEFERARALGDSEQVLTDYALLLSSTGRCDEAVRIRDAAVALAPASVSARANRALYLFWCDRFAEALRAADEIAAVDPDSQGALYARWRVHELSGNWVEALASLRRIAALQPVFASEVEINVRVYRADGAAGYWRHRAENNARLGRIDEAAAGYAALGDVDAAFAQLESGFAAKDPQLTVLLYSPYLKPLRSDPRFADLARRMGLPAPKP